MSCPSEIYSQKEKCYEDIHFVREIFGNKNSTAQKYKTALECLTFMLLYCPGDILSVVHSTMEELQTREQYQIFNNETFRQQWLELNKG